MSSVPCPKSTMELLSLPVCFCLLSTNTTEKWILWKTEVCRTVWRGREQESGDSSKYHTRWSRKSDGVGILLAPPGPWLSLSEHDCFHNFNSLCCSDSLSSQSLVEAEAVKCQVSSEHLYPMVSSPSSSVGLNSSPPAPISCFSLVLSSPFMAWISDSSSTSPAPT